MNILAIAAANATQAESARGTRMHALDFAGVLSAAQTAGSSGAAATAAATVRSPLMAARLVLPTREAVEELASELSDKLAARLSAAGIAADPSVTLSVDDQGGIKVAGERSDLADIEALVTGSDELARAVRTTSAIASHAYAIENGGHLEFQRAYRLSADPAEVVAQYAHPLGLQHAAVMSLSFGSGGLGVTADGAAWIKAV